jgi:hypothetical protein
MQGTDQFGVRGRNGTLLVMPDRIVIKRKRSFVALLGQGLSGDRAIEMDHLAGVRYRPATRIMNGFIRFSLSGDPEPKGGGFDAAQDEHAVMFTVKQQPGFEHAKRLVDRYREALRAESPAPGS